MVASVSDVEAPTLIAAIDGARLSPFRFQEWLGKRLTHSFGWHYDFYNGNFAAFEPIPDWFEPLRIHAEDFAGLTRGSLVQALVIRYDVGAGIGWHRPRPHFEHVVGISLGSPATLRLRRRVGTRFERANVPLDSCSAHHLIGEARHDWEYSKVELRAPRWSITFRSLSDNGRALLSAAASPVGNRE